MLNPQVINVQDLSFRYESGDPVFSSLDFAIAENETVALVGPSGCGKSTLLRLIAGLETPETGRIQHRSAGEDSRDDELRLLFQDYDAFPWLTVRDNLGRGSGPEPYPKPKVIADAIAAVGLRGFENRYPNELSGGMRKRLALARAIIRKPRLLMLDEPFASLDVDTRSAMHRLVQDLWMQTRCGVVLVTHDLHEAISLATRIDVASHRPMHIKQSLDVTLPRPRNESIVDTDVYRDLYRTLLRLLSSPE
jgi:NitT/TauT family transport system ATP-binding protein